MTSHAAATHELPSELRGVFFHDDRRKSRRALETWFEGSPLPEQNDHSARARC